MAELAARIDMSKAVKVKPLRRYVWLGVVDKDGNAVSLIQSIYHDYGSGIVAAAKILLQNRVASFR